MKEWIIHYDECGDQIVAKELVRCKDCEWRGELHCCRMFDGETDSVPYDDWFCADGQRKDVESGNSEN